jgi:glucosamine kinase
MAILIADSGATKCEWCLVEGKKKKTIFTMGISPYFLTAAQIKEIAEKEVLAKFSSFNITQVYFYGTGCKNENNRKIIVTTLKKVFVKAGVKVSHDMMGAAISLCGNQKGVACILGTGSSSCFFNGKTIVKSRTGLGYVLGDEGSGAYLGKIVLQYYLYNTFDDELRYRFEELYKTNETEILENVYRKPLPSKYLAGYANFLGDNRGHYMVENIIEDGLNDFFFSHIIKYNESWKNPVHFVGGVAYAFKDVVKELCRSYELELGKIIKNPMEGLVKFHNQ